MTIPTLVDRPPHAHAVEPARPLLPVLIVAGLAALAPSFVWSQSTRLPTAPGVWKPWKGLTAAASARTDAGVTPVQLKAFEAELLTLNGLAARATGVATPVGFSVETWASLDAAKAPAHAPGHPGPRTLPLSGSMTFGAFPIFEYVRNGKTIREDTGETALQGFVVNTIDRAVFRSEHVAEFGAIDHDAFLLPARSGEIAGLPRYGDLLIVAREPDALFVPLTLGAALEIARLHRAGEVTSSRQSLEKFTAQLAVVRDPARRARRLKEAADVAPNTPDPAAFVASIEAALGIEEAAVVAELSPTGGASRQLADAERAVAEVTAWLDDMTPAERDQPACYAEQGRGLRARFAAAPAAGCVPLVRPNYAYFNQTLPRSAPQVLLITGIARCFDTANPGNRDALAPGPSGCAANRALIETIDKSALRAWLR